LDQTGLGAYHFDIVGSWPQEKNNINWNAVIMDSIAWDSHDAAIAKFYDRRVHIIKLCNENSFQQEKLRIDAIRPKAPQVHKVQLSRRRPKSYSPVPTPVQILLALAVLQSRQRKVRSNAIMTVYH
jgi:hypothetical protein